jgi:hypothetical protein
VDSVAESTPRYLAICWTNPGKSFFQQEQPWTVES